MTCPAPTRWDWRNGFQACRSDGMVEFWAPNRWRHEENWECERMLESLLS